jgi:hypothetical protein
MEIFLCFLMIWFLENVYSAQNIERVFIFGCAQIYLTLLYIYWHDITGTVQVYILHYFRIRNGTPAIEQGS